MTLQFDLETEDYDLTCYGVEAWPAPDGVREYSNLYLEVTEDTEADDGSLTVIDVPYHTSYSFFQEGDYKRAAMDAAQPDVAMADRRASYTYAGKYCMYWDNWDGMNPQPWAALDCGLQALWLNDYYYECTYDSEYAYEYYCDLSGYAAYDDTYGFGCLDYDLETYECVEYACLYGSYLDYNDGEYTVEDFYLGGIQYYDGDYYCYMTFGEYYSDAYNCDVYDNDTYTCLCYTTATYNTIDDYTCDREYQAVYCHSGVDDYGYCLDDCATWYTTNDADGVCWCAQGGDLEEYYYTAADESDPDNVVPASCDMALLQTLC
jgi:hypothetical protein